MAEIKKTVKVPGDVVCGFCSGTGKHQNVKCVVCGGSGKVNVVDSTRKCQWCKGKGYSLPNIPCTNCGGTGATRPVDRQRLF